MASMYEHLEREADERAKAQEELLLLREENAAMRRFIFRLYWLNDMVGMGDDVREGYLTKFPWLKAMDDARPEFEQVWED